MSNNETGLNSSLEIIELLIQNEKYDSALKQLDEILKENPYRIDALLMKADIYFLQNHFERALATYGDLQKIYESHYSDKIETLEYYHILKKIAISHKLQENIAQSINYYKNLLQMYDILKDKKDNNPTLEEKIFILNQLGDLYTKSKNYITGLKYYKKLLKIHNKQGNNEAIAEDAITIGDVYAIQKQYNKAKKMYNSALNYYEKTEDQGAQGILHYNLGAINYKKGDYHKALTHLESALMKFEKLSLEKKALEMEQQQYYNDTLKLWKKLKKLSFE